VKYICNSLQRSRVDQACFIKKRYKFVWYFQVLEDALEWLNEWEMAFRTGDITADEYLTPETSRNFRITLQSSINMCRYLIEKFDFQYILTGKVNQDNLEVFSIYIEIFVTEKLHIYGIYVCTYNFFQKFFGTVRQAAGCNDHPNCPTFLQLYKL